MLDLLLLSLSLGLHIAQSRSHLQSLGPKVGIIPRPEDVSGGSARDGMTQRRKGAQQKKE